MSDWDKFYKQFITYGGYKRVINGLLATVEIAVIGLVIGIIIGTLIGAVKVIKKKKSFLKIIDKFCTIYVSFFRGTPMVVQLLIGHFVLMPALGITINSVFEAAIIFGLNSGAYVSEIMRAGIQSVDVGQFEAGRAVGLTYSTTMFKIIIPQAIKNIIPTLGNEFISLIKETSVVSFIAVIDVTRAFRQIGDAMYSYLIPYLMLAIVYLLLVILISIGVKAIEKKLMSSDRRSDK